MNLDALREQFIDLAERVAPCLFPRLPLYMVCRSDLPESLHGFFVGSGCSGCYASNFDCRLYNFLTDAGLWCGRGPLIFLNDNVLRDVSEQFKTYAALSILVHEMGHVCEDSAGWVSPRPVPEVFIGKSESPIASLAPVVAKSVASGPPWAWHCSEWIRCMVHLRYRCDELGFRFGMDALSVAGKRYGLSWEGSYQISLGDEPERLAGVPFASILQTPPPAEFVALWRADTAAGV